MKYTVYVITNLLSNKKYVGKTAHSIAKRFEEHARDKRTSRYISSAIRKYGKDNFKIEVYKNTDSLKDLNKLEQEAIQILNTKAPNGYNLSDGGDGPNGASEETRMKMSLAKRNNTYRRGQKWSWESRINFSKKRGYFKPLIATEIKTNRRTIFFNEQ